MQQMQVVHVEGDGNCMFRSVSHQVYGTDTHHPMLRQATAAYMLAERAYFSGWVADDFGSYVARLSQNGTWGDDPELQALSELYDRPVEVWMHDPVSGAKVLKRLHEAREGVAPIRLSYYGGGHYDSIVGPGHANCLLTSDAGTREEGMLRAVRLRNTPEGRAGASVAMQSDLQAVIQASRLAYADQDTSIEAALRASLQAPSEALDAAAADGCDDEVATTAAMASSEVEAADLDLVQAVQADTEAAATQEAILQHLQAEARRKEQADLDAAIAASNAHRASGDTDMAAPPSGCEGSLGTQDATLAAALAASMQDSTGGTSHAVQCGDEEDDAMLLAALALSMQKQE
jgi:OTU domain-containing protein 5